MSAREFAILGNGVQCQGLIKDYLKTYYEWMKEESLYVKPDLRLTHAVFAAEDVATISLGRAPAGHAREKMTATAP